MGFGKFLTGVTLATGVGLAAYFTLTKQDPRVWAQQLGDQIKDTVDKVDDVKTAKDNVTTKVAALDAAVTTATPAIEDIQSDVEKFAFKIGPRVEEIQDTVSRWDKL